MIENLDIFQNDELESLKLKFTEIQISLTIPSITNNIGFTTDLYRFPISPGRIISILISKIQCPDMSRMIALTIGPLDVDPADDGRCLIRFFFCCK